MRGQILSFDGHRILRPGAQSYRSGMTLGIHAEAELAGRGRITWIGVHVTSPVDIVDSVAVPDSLGKSLTAGFGIPTSAEYTGPVAVRVFARTAGGQRVEAELHGSPATLFRDVVRPIRYTMPSEPTTEFRLDPSRNVAYFPQPRALTINVMDLATLSHRVLLTVPDTVPSIDVTTDGTTLVGVMPARKQLLIVDLRPLTPVVSRVVDLVMPTPFVPDMPYFPKALRVAADGRVLVTLSFRGSGFSPLLEYDLASGEQRVRTDPGAIDPQRIVSASARMERSLSGDRVAIFLNYSCCAPSIRMYSSGSGSVSGLFGYTDAGFDPTVSLDSAGTRLLLGSTLLDGSMRVLAAYYAPSEMFVSALSLDGRTVYARNAIGDRTGMLVMDAATGAVLEGIPLGSSPVRFIPLPGRAELMVLGGSGRVNIVDLSGAQTTLQMSHSAGHITTSGRNPRERRTSGQLQ